MLHHFDFLNVLAPYNPILAPDKFLSWTISNKNSLTSYYLVAFMFSYFIIYNDSSSLYFNSIPKIIINNFIKIFYFDNSSEEGNLNSNSPFIYIYIYTHTHIYIYIYILKIKLRHWAMINHHAETAIFSSHTFIQSCYHQELMDSDQNNVLWAFHLKISQHMNTPTFQHTPHPSIKIDQSKYCSTSCPSALFKLWLGLCYQHTHINNLHSYNNGGKSGHLCWKISLANTLHVTLGR